VAGTVTNAFLPGVGSIVGSAVSFIGGLITDLINHGAVIHNQENEILCAVVPRAANALIQTVQAFRAGQISASQAQDLMSQILSGTQQALGSEAGRGSGQGLLRNIAVVNAYFAEELPMEAQTQAAPEAATAAASVAALTGLPTWAVWLGGAAAVLYLLH
jgi:hypothetical protein